MQTAILVKGLSLAQEARIIRKLENARRQSAKYAREKQRAIELATAVKVGTVADYPVYHAKSLSLRGDQNAPECIAKYHARINAKNHRSDLARKMVAGKTPNAAPYRLGEIVATDDFLSLYMHRIKVVRPEARAAHLALGFLRGKSYVTMENKSYDWPNWTRIQEIITKYGDGDIRVLLQRFEQWKQEAEKRGLIREPGPGGWEEAESAELSHGVKATPKPGPDEPLKARVLADTENGNGFLSQVKAWLAS